MIQKSINKCGQTCLNNKARNPIGFRQWVVHSYQTGHITVMNVVIQKIEISMQVLILEIVKLTK